MSIKSLKLNEFKKIFKPSLYTGVGLLRLVKDDKGNPIINPTRQVLSKYLSNVSEEGDAFEYFNKYELAFGYNDYSDKGGLKRMSKEEYDKLDFQAKEAASLPTEVDSCRVSFLMEGEIEGKDEAGNLIKEKLYDLIQFRFIDAARFNNDGTKMEVINTLGQTNWVASDSVYSKSFRTDVQVSPAFDKTGNFGIEELIDFIYSYGAISKGEKGIELLQEIRFTELFEGNVDSLIDLFNFIETERTVVKEGKKIELFGIMALATPVNGKSTDNKNSQSFYPVFERGIQDEEGNINTAFSKIKSALAKDRTPAKKTGISYSPESKGIYVGVNNQPSYGFHRIDEKVMETFVAYNNVNTSSRPISTKGTTTNVSNGAVEDNPFGI
jgi:hypothetical protein